MKLGVTAELLKELALESATPAPDIGIKGSGDRSRIEGDRAPLLAQLEVEKGVGESLSAPS